MFERFTDRARDVVRRALEEARVEGQRPVGTEHLLLALLADDASLASRVLADAGVRADDLRERVRRHTASGGAGLGDADAAALREIGIDLAAIVARIEQSFGPDALREAVPAPRRRWGRKRYLGGPFSPRSKKVLELSLREIGIDLAAIVARIEQSFGPDALREAVPAPRRRWGRKRFLGGPFSPRSKKVLELSLREALRLRHRHIGTEHILLGVLREGHGLGALVLTEAGVDLDDLRRRVEAALRAAA